METLKEGGVTSFSISDEPVMSNQSPKEPLNQPSSGGLKTETHELVASKEMRKDIVIYPSDILQSEDYTLVTQHLPVLRLFIYYKDYKMECDPNTQKIFFTQVGDKDKALLFNEASMQLYGKPAYQLSDMTLNIFEACDTGLDDSKDVLIRRGGQVLGNYACLMVTILAREITRVLNGSCFYQKLKNGKKEEDDEKEQIIEIEDLDISERNSTKAYKICREKEHDAKNEKAQK